MKNTAYIKTRVFSVTIATLTLLSILSCNNYQNPGNNSGKTGDGTTADSLTSKKSRDIGNDEQFLDKAAEINLEEIQLGKLAQQNGTITAVKELGRMLVDDHTKSLNDLTVLAKNKSMMLPTSLNNEGQDAYKKLSSKSGNDFDKTFCDMMVNGHKDAIALFEKESTKADDADIRQWATSTLPTLQKHLNNAITCQQNCEK